MMHKIFQLDQLSFMFKLCPACLELLVGMQFTKIEAAIMLECRGYLFKNEVDIFNMFKNKATGYKRHLFEISRFGDIRLFKLNT